MNQLSNYLSYDSQANGISFSASPPSVNDGYQLRKIAGTSIIVIKLVDIKGYEASYELNFTFIVPLMFISDLPDITVVVGEPSSATLPELLVEEGYQLKEAIVEPSLH